MPCNIHFLLSAFHYIAKRSSEWVQGSKGEGAKQMGPQRRQAWLTGEGNWEKVESQGERMVKGCCRKRVIWLMEQTVSGGEGETNSKGEMTEKLFPAGSDALLWNPLRRMVLWLKDLLFQSYLGELSKRLLSVSKPCIPRKVKQSKEPHTAVGLATICR